MKRGTISNQPITGASDCDKEFIQAIKDAVMYNNDLLEDVKKFINKGANVNYIDSNGETALSLILFSIHYQRFKIAEYLIGQKADLNSNQPYNLLHQAILKNDKQIFSFVLKKGADPNVKRNGYSALHLTCRDLEFNNVIKCHPFISCRNSKECKNAKECWEPNTKLKIAKSKIKMAEKLIKYHANVNALANGMTPLHYLCHLGGNEKILESFTKIFIAHGANKEDIFDGMTPLQHAIINNRIEIMQVLIDAGANPNVTYKGKTLLKTAHKTETKEMLILKLKAKYPTQWTDEQIGKILDENDKTVDQSSLRIFANIFNDMHLRASNLQGLHLFDAAKYMQDFIKRFLDNKFRSSANAQEAISIQSKALLQLLELIMMGEYATRNDLSKNPIDIFIEHFEKNKHILVPGGWSGLTDHHMIYEFKENQEGCILSIWNTGPGLEYHLFEETSNSKLYYPVKTYQMPPYDTLKKYEFKNYLKLLLEYKNQRGDQQTLYKEIIPNIVFLNGQEFESLAFKNHKIEKQWSNTSAWQVILTMLKHYGFEGLTPDEFQYEVMLDGFSRFVERLTDKDYQRQDVILQLQYAIKNFALFLKKMNFNVNDTVKREKALKLIKETSQKLKDEPIDVKDIHFAINANSSFIIPKRLKSIENKLFEQNEQPYVSFMDYKPLDKVGLDPTLDKATIQAILNESENAHVNLLRRVENIIFNLPNTQAYWEKLSGDQIREFISLLPALSEKYYNLCRTLNYHYAENIVALRICYYLGAFLFKIIDPYLASYKDPTASLKIDLGITKTFSLDQESEMQSEYFTITQENVARGINNFDLPVGYLDTYLMDLPQKNQALQSESREHIHYVKDILPHARIYEVSSQNIPAIYYFLKRRQSDPYSKEGIEYRYPDLEQNFQTILSILALKEIYRWGLSGFIAVLGKISSNKWEVVKLGSGERNHGELKVALAQKRASKPISESHYIKDDKILNDLKDIVNPNTQIEVQIPFSQNYRRILAHIRSTQDSKIVAAIEFIKSNLLQFDRPDLQTCLFLFLFQGENLSQEIKVNPKAIDHLFKCIEKGIEYYQDPKSIFTLLFFYKLNTFLNQFLINTNSHDLQEQHKLWIARSFQINNNVELLFTYWAYKQDKSDNLSVANVVNYLTLMHLYNIHTYLGKLSREQCHLFLIGNCFLSQLPIENLDPFVIKEMIKAQDALKYAVMVSDYDPLPMLSTICKLFNIQLDENSIKRPFPFYFHDDNVGIDLLNGSIIRKNSKEEILPKFFYDENFKALFSEKEIKAQKINGSSYEFIHHNTPYRIAISSNGYFLQKFLFDKWFQLLSSKELIGFGQSDDKMYLPLTLVDETKLVWQSGDGFFIICERKTNKTQYFYNADSGTMYKFNKQEKPQWTLDREIQIEVIKNFEDPSFSEVWHDIETKQIIINLPRYGLKFYSVLDAPFLQFACKAYENYRLSFNKLIPIRNFDQALVLEPIDIKSKLETLYLIPKQVFLPTQYIEEDAYSKLTLDIGNKVKTVAFLDTKWKNFKGQINRSDLDVSTLSDENNYQNQEQFAIYTQGEDGLLKTQKIQDKFYLAYLYFAKRDTQKCFQLLRKLVHAEKGHEQLIYLRYIITDTPFQGVSEIGKNCITEGPEDLAIRLFALYIINEYFKNGETRKNLQSNNIKGKVNIQADKFQKLQLEKFLEKEAFHKITINILSAYLSNEKYISNDMRLKNDQLLSIFGSLNINDQEQFQLKVKQTELFFKSLYKEYYGLLNLAGIKLNVHQENRKRTLEQELDKVYHFIPHSSILQNQLMSISIVDTIGRTYIVSSGSSLIEPIKIQHLALATPNKYLRNSILNLYEEAKKDALKKAQLLEFLDYKLQYFLVGKEWLLTNYSSTIYAVLLLKAMLENQDKTDELLKNDNPSNPNFKYPFIKENYVKSLLAIKTKENTDKTFTIERSPVNYTPLAQRKIQPFKSNVVNNPIPKNLKNVFKAGKGDHPFFALLAQEMNAELSMGEKINQEAKARNDKYLQSYDEIARLALLDKSNKVINQSQVTLDILKNEIEFAINKGPENDPVLWELEKSSHSVKTLTLNDALEYFSKYPLSQIQEKRSLSAKSANDLIEKIRDFLIEKTKQQKYERIKRKLREIDECQDNDTKNHLIFQLGSIDEQERCYNPNEFPEMLLFEYQKDILIYENQYRIILKLLEKNENGVYASKIIKLIMGGGKTEVILQLLTRLCPDGNNLIVVEVPPELFETYLEILPSKRRLPFKFHRNMQCDAYYFSQLAKSFSKIISKKGYILTTKNSMDSLNLKYIDILTNEEVSKESDEQAEHLSQIIYLLKNQGHCIIDEIDLTLNPKDQLIYIIGEGKRIEKHLLRALVGLYDFPRGNFPAFYSIINGESSRPQEEILTNLFNLLIENVIDSPDSPINAIVNKLDKDERLQIFAYLKNKIKLIESTYLTGRDRDILALYKEELSRLLPLSIKKDPDEHYGLPKEKKEDPLAQEVAIPFLGNNTPYETAQFEDVFLAINYTVQVQLRRPVSYHVFEKFIQNFKEEFEAAQALKGFSALGVDVQSKFEDIIKRNDLKLNELDINTAQINQWYSLLKNEIGVKKYCLTEIILPSILNFTVSLASDAQNHTDMYRSLSGFSATNFIRRTFPDSILQENEESFGTDGRTIDYLLNAREQKVHVLQENKFSELTSILDKHPKKTCVRAIIDRGAFFQGIPNREVANKLSHHFSRDTYKECDIKYILYFNKKGVLCAIKTSQTPEKEKRLKLASTVDVDKILKCTSAQRVSYYSQQQTRGIHLNQAPDTIGIIFLSEHTTLDELIQAVMRLRDLKGTHLIEYVIMRGLASFFPRVWNTISILNVALYIQTKFLMNCHLTSVMQKIRNIFRRDLLHCIETAKSIVAKKALAKAFEKYLYDFDNLSFFDKYGAPETQVKTKKFLKNYLNEKTLLWLSCFEDKQILETLKNKLVSDCQEIIKNSLSICENYQKSNIWHGGDNHVIGQRQQENEMQNEIAFGVKTSVEYLSWRGTNWLNWHPSEKMQIPCYQLEEQAQVLTKRSWCFSPFLYLSYNFLKTCKEIPGAFNTFAKPSCYMLVMIKNDILMHVLITEREAGELRPMLSGNQGNIWIESISGVPYAGNKPEGIEENESYQSNLEQLQYFSGDLIYLILKGAKLKWLQEHGYEKMDFLKNYILGCHPNKAALLSILERIFKLDTEIENQEYYHYEIISNKQNTLLYQALPSVNILQNNFNTRSQTATPSLLLKQ